MVEKINAVVKSMRPPFLILTPVCIFLGIAVALQLHGSVNADLAILVVIGALAAHISVNTFNEYFDYSSGLDLITTRTPFSGGSGGIPEVPNALNSVLAVAIITLIITIAIGLYLVSIKGMALLWLGIIGVVTIVLYTRWINRVAELCLISPGLAFGPLFVVGTYISVTDVQLINSETLLVASLASLVPFFLVNNLLLLNQFPDVDADKKVGRSTFPISYGFNISINVYLVFVLLTAIAIVIAVLMQKFHWLILFGVLPLILGVNIYKGVKQVAFATDKMIPYMGKNVGLTLITIFVLGILITVSAKI